MLKQKCKSLLISFSETKTFPFWKRDKILLVEIESGEYMDIGKRIVSLREKKQWNQREFAKRINLNVSVMNRIELGERSVRDHELLKISEALGVTADYLLGKTEHPNFTEGMSLSEKTEKLLEILSEMPEQKREKTEDQVLAYIRGLNDASIDD